MCWHLHPNSLCIKDVLWVLVRCGGGAFPRSAPPIVEQDHGHKRSWCVEQTIDPVGHHCDVCAITTSKKNILDVSSSCTQTPRSLLQTFQNILKNPNIRVYRTNFHQFFLSPMPVSRCTIVWVHALNPTGSLQWNFQTYTSYCDYVITLIIYQCPTVRT